MSKGRTNPSRQWLGQQAKGVQGWIRGAIVCGVAVGVAILIQMMALAWIVDQAVTESLALSALWPGVALALAATGVRVLAQWGQEVCGQEAGLRAKRHVRAQWLTALHRLGPVGLASRHSAGLAHQLIDQVEALEGYYARFLPQMWLALIVPSIYWLAVVWLDWLAALWLLLAAPLIPLFMALIGMGAQRLNEAQFQAVTRLSGHFLDRVRGITTLKLFGWGERSVVEVDRAAHEYRRRSLKTLRVAFLSSAVLEFFAAVSVAVVAIYIGFGLLGYIDYGPAGSLDLFSGLLILLLAPEFFQPLRTLSQHYHDRASALGAAEGLRALMAESDSIPSHGDDETEPPAGVAVRLQAVTLSHVGRAALLGPVSLEVEAGEVVALIGPSGCGKSSLLQAIAGFLLPSEGRVQIRRESGLAWVDQRALIIQGTVAENLRVVAPAASDEALISALAQAELAAWLAATPAGLETPLGERGYGLSGGEAQRLALARVFLSSAPLILLDEPTAALDRDTEREVIVALQRLADSGRTLLVATHHPAIMAMADRVFAIEDGVLKAVDAPMGAAAGAAS